MKKLLFTLIIASLICVTAFAAPTPVVVDEYADEFFSVYLSEDLGVQPETTSPNTPVTHTSVHSIRTNDPVGIRFEAEIPTNHTASEFGWVITRQAFLSAAGINAGEFTKESNVPMVSGVNFNRAQGKNDIFKSENGIDTFTAVLTEIDADNYGAVIVARPYAVDENGTWYGEPYSVSFKGVASYIKESETYASLTNDQSAVIDSIINGRETAYAEYRVVSSFEIMQDENDKWRAYYDLYDVIAGTKLYEIPSENSYDRASDVVAHAAGDVVVLKGGKYVSEEGSLSTANLSVNSLVWLGDYDAAEKTFTAVPYTTELGSCDTCITEYMNKAQGENVDFMTGEKIGNTIKITNKTAVTVIKNNTFEGIWQYGTINTIWPDDALIKNKNDIKCHNDRAENQNGFYTGYSKYAKAYVSAENGVAKAIVIVVNGNEPTALKELCGLHK